MSEFQLDDLKQILRSCPEYEAGHHMQRPYMSAYQIAIHFAHAHPEHPAVQRLPVGGVGSGENQSLAQRIARFLSKVVSDRVDQEIEGAFLSHAQLREMQFEAFDGSRIHVSTLASDAGHSIFKVIG